ncbi:hypothetical protein SDC9_68815 [bioreactor metagenome]|uniref:Uncharacterized protein n=1 Tax=bioreactor metagenome TaxID=1076179 RepID=A0A644Y712_9ZZZZ
MIIVLDQISGFATHETNHIVGGAGWVDIFFFDFFQRHVIVLFCNFQDSRSRLFADSWLAVQRE